MDEMVTFMFEMFAKCVHLTQTLVPVTVYAQVKVLVYFGRIGPGFRPKVFLSQFLSYCPFEDTQ